MLVTLFILGPPKAQKKTGLHEENSRHGGVSVWPSGHGGLRPRDRFEAAAGDLHGRTFQVGAAYSLHRSHRHKSEFHQCVRKAGTADLHLFRKVWMNLHADPEGTSLPQRGCQEILYLKLPPSRLRTSSWRCGRWVLVLAVAPQFFALFVGSFQQRCFIL